MSQVELLQIALALRVSDQLVLPVNDTHLQSAIQTQLVGELRQRTDRHLADQATSANRQGQGHRRAGADRGEKTVRPVGVLLLMGLTNEIARRQIQPGQVLAQVAFGLGQPDDLNAALGIGQVDRFVEVRRVGVSVQQCLQLGGR